MTEPTEPTGPPAAGPSASGPVAFSVRRIAAVSLGTVAGTALLGVAAGFIWAAVAPRALLVMVSPGAADLVHPESTVFIVADAWFCLITLAGGVITGVLGYLLAVRKHGPAAMAAVLAGAVAAAFLARWLGEGSGHATVNHLLATLPAGAHLRDSLSLASSAALGAWPFGAGLVAGGLEALAGRRRRVPGSYSGESGAVGPQPGSSAAPGPA